MTDFGVGFLGDFSTLVTVKWYFTDSTQSEGSGWFRDRIFDGRLWETTIITDGHFN